MVKRSREDFDTPSKTEHQDSSDDSSDSRSLDSHPQTAISTAGNSKLLHLDKEGGEALITTEVMRCSLPPHTRQTISFSSFEEYEVHYNKTHVNRCAECRKNFPTPHFLDLHISENHNPLVEVLKERGERTYGCFVGDCDRKCSTPQKRRMHLIDKHAFPKDYDFFIVNSGIDQRSSMLRSGRHRRRSSAAHHKIDIEDRARRRVSELDKVPREKFPEQIPAASNDGDSMQISEAGVGEEVTSETQRADLDMDELSGAMSALKFVPPSVRFGRSKGRGGFSKS